MAVNAEGVFRRTVDHEQEDLNQLFENAKKESWKDWPNEAGFDALDEHRGPIDLVVKGTIPTWAAGALYRTGPGQCRVPETSRGTHHISHWFDGLGHTHKFDIRPATSGSCTVSYSSRRQSEQLAKRIKEIGWRGTLSFAQRKDPCVGIFGKFMSVFEKSINNNVVVELNLPSNASKSQRSTTSEHRTGVKNAFVMTDNDVLQEIDPDTLEPVGFSFQHNFHPDLKGAMGCAHSPRDPVNGDLFNFNLSFGRYATYRVFRLNAATGTTDILATIAFADIKPAYIHSMFLTENHIIMCIPSTHFSWNGVKIPMIGNVVEAIDKFDESKLSQWVVIDRRHGKGIVARFTTPAGFFFHSINAFEETIKKDKGTETTAINLDCVWYNSFDIINCFYYDVLLNQNNATRKHYLDNGGSKKCQPRLVRYRLPLPSTPFKSSSPVPSGEQVFAITCPHIGELPTINDSYTTKPHRYVYSTPTRSLSTMTDAIVKTDVQTRDALIWGAPKGHTPGEAVFVERPGAEVEDDGVLLSVVLDGMEGKSYLLCLDAKDLSELGRAEVGFAVGVGFHGIHAREVASSKGTDEVEAKL